MAEASDRIVNFKVDDESLLFKLTAYFTKGNRPVFEEDVADDDRWIFNTLIDQEYADEINYKSDGWVELHFYDIGDIDDILDVEPDSTLQLFRSLGVSDVRVEIYYDGEKVDA